MNTSRCYHTTIKLVLSLVTTSAVSGCYLEDYLAACSSFAEKAKIQQTLSEQAAVVRQVEQVRPGHVDVMVGEIKRCPGKARISIGHATEKDRQKIERIIGPQFFGLPYRTINW